MPRTRLGRQTPAVSLQVDCAAHLLPNAPSKPGLYRLLQFLRWPERDLFAGRDFDRSTRRRVSAHACRSVSHLQDAEASKADFVALLEMTGRERHQIAQDSF